MYLLSSRSTIPFRTAHVYMTKQIKVALHVFSFFSKFIQNSFWDSTYRLPETASLQPFSALGYKNKSAVLEFDHRVIILVLTVFLVTPRVGKSKDISISQRRISIDPYEFG